jgi:8-amino-7-oxononanoate synthase
MLDFSSVLYLGMHHPSRSLRPWETLTYGAPAALRAPEGAVLVAQNLAELQGCERAVLAPSTLHLFWDLFSILSRDDTAIYMDAGVYPIGRWGVERAASRGVPVKSFSHYRPDALKAVMRNDSNCRRRPVILSDGFCPACGRPAPVSEYAAFARAAGGLLILDDTQALGIFGHSPGKDNPYGIGGGGMLQWSNNANNQHVLMISSMAKGFGVPVAVLSGSNGMLRWFEEKSNTRLHCSPPSAAAVHAAEHALTINRKYGEQLRLRLTRTVHYFRSRMAKAGFVISGGLFPVQTLISLPERVATALHEHLLRQGIRTVLHQRRAGQGARISFLINADHRMADIDYLVNAIIHGVITHRQNITEAAYEL